MHVILRLEESILFIETIANEGKVGAVNNLISQISGDFLFLGDLELGSLRHLNNAHRRNIESKVVWIFLAKRRSDICGDESHLRVGRRANQLL